MIRIKRSELVSPKTAATFGPHSKAAWRAMRPLRREFYQNLRGVWTLSIDNEPICVVGLRRYTILGFGGEIIFFLCEAFSKNIRKAVPFIRRALRRLARLWGRLCVRVEDGFWIGHRFVSFFGFEKVLHNIDSAGNGSTLYQLRATWQ
jgi:hypothetical protein